MVEMLLFLFHGIIAALKRYTFVRVESEMKGSSANQLRADTIQRLGTFVALKRLNRNSAQYTSCMCLHVCLCGSIVFHRTFLAVSIASMCARDRVWIYIYYAVCVKTRVEQSWAIVCIQPNGIKIDRKKTETFSFFPVSMLSHSDTQYHTGLVSPSVTNLKYGISLKF